MFLLSPKTGKSDFPKAKMCSEWVVGGVVLLRYTLERASLDADLGDWLTGYIANLVARGELFALRRGGELIGTGECRVSETQPPYADLGVIVGRDHRRQGVASHILRWLKDHCYGRDLDPICSTTVDNIGAQKAIVRAGFLSRQRMVEVSF